MDSRGGVFAVIEGTADDGFSAAIDKETGAIRQDRAGRSLRSGSVCYHGGREYVSIVLEGPEVKPGTHVRIEAPLIRTKNSAFFGTGRLTHIDGKSLAPVKAG